jgi:uncharacterized coiled-coil protein SlyX
MKSDTPLKSAAWAAAGAALLGGGMLLGFVSAVVGGKKPGRRRKEEEPAAGALRGAATLDPISARRIDELAGAVVELQARLDGLAAPAPGAANQRLNAITERLEEIEKRVDQIATEGAGPPVDQILNAVEHMVTEKIAGLDERLTDQLQAIELLRGASAQTDVLLQKLLNAVEALGSQTEKAQSVEAEPEDESPSGPPKEYPFA